MADLLNQDEIDSLLSSSMEEEETSEDSDASVAEKEKPAGKTKSFAFRKERTIRFIFPYHSPVLKKGKFVFDPNPDFESGENQIVVRTLKNYIDYVNNKRNSY